MSLPKLVSLFRDHVGVLRDSQRLRVGSAGVLSECLHVLRGLARSELCRSEPQHGANALKPCTENTQPGTQQTQDN